MNKERRKAIGDSSTLVATALAKLENVREDEQIAYDNMPESLQQGERGLDMAEGIRTLERTIESLERCVQNLIHLEQ